MSVASMERAKHIRETPPVPPPEREWAWWRIVSGGHVDEDRDGNEFYVHANRGKASCFESGLPLDRMHNQPGSIKFERLLDVPRQRTVSELKRLLAEAEAREGGGQSLEGAILVDDGVETPEQTAPAGPPKLVGTGPGGIVTDEDHQRHMEQLAAREMM